jgi:hypothetical protein
MMEDKEKDIAACHQHSLDLPADVLDYDNRSVWLMSRTIIFVFEM